MCEYLTNTYLVLRQLAVKPELKAIAMLTFDLVHRMPSDLRPRWLRLDASSLATEFWVVRHVRHLAESAHNIHQHGSLRAFTTRLRGGRWFSWSGH